MTKPAPYAFHTLVYCSRCKTERVVSPERITEINKKLRGGRPMSLVHEANELYRKTQKERMVAQRNLHLIDERLSDPGDLSVNEYNGLKLDKSAKEEDILRLNHILSGMSAMRELILADFFSPYKGGTNE